MVLAMEAVERGPRSGLGVVGVADTDCAQSARAAMDGRARPIAQRSGRSQDGGG